jgi:hypothetical protein
MDMVAESGQEEMGVFEWGPLRKYNYPFSIRANLG